MEAAGAGEGDGSNGQSEWYAEGREGGRRRGKQRMQGVLEGAKRPFGCERSEPSCNYPREARVVFS